MTEEIENTREIEEVKVEDKSVKNSKYKLMLKSGNIITENKSSINLSNLEKFLEDNKQHNINEQWSKLDKTIKLKKVATFADTYALEHNYSQEDKEKLLIFLKDCLDKKKLARVKDVIYDKATGLIKEIPALYKTAERFTLKNMDKRISTLKNLPQKSSATIAQILGNEEIIEDL